MAPRTMLRAAFAIPCLFMAACTVGELPAAGGGQDAGADAAPVANGCINRVTAVDPHEHGGAGGPTHAGENCQVGGCHLVGNTGTGAPAFVASGTLYKPGGVTPSAGANIVVKPTAGGAATNLVSDTAGNFSITAAITFPAKTEVSGCPTIQKMVGDLATAADGACNKCHAKTGGTTAPITLPDM